jgi:hypothetical protein
MVAVYVNVRKGAMAMPIEREKMSKKEVKKDDELEFSLSSLFLFSDSGPSGAQDHQNFPP